MRLRIAHVAGLSSLKYGGFERFMLCLARECARRGHDFHCIWEQRPTSKAVEDDLAAAGARSHVLPSTGRPLAFAVRLAAWLARERIHVLHGHFNPACLAALAAARLVQVPLPVCSLHSGLSDEFIAGFPLRSQVMARLRRALAARVFPVSNVVKQQYDSFGFGGRAFHVHYLGVPAAVPRRTRAQVRAELGLGERELVIGCIAFHGPVKGVDVLLRAISLLTREFPTLRLLQIGGSTPPACDPDTETLHRLGRELGLDGQIVWAGRRNDVRDLLETMDVYCQPSRSEGLPLAVLEAMSAGLPVVASRVGGIPEAVSEGRTGLFSEPEQPQSLAAALADLLREPALRRRMGRLARETVRAHFDADRQAARLIDIYEQMMSVIRPA